MYVCNCQGVTERQIRAAVRAGARSVEDLQRELGVSRQCGRCAADVQACLQEALAALDEKGPRHHKG